MKPSARKSSGLDRRHATAIRTRSGVEKITWNSDSEVRLHITYTNISIVVCIDTSKPNQPRITALF